jgi:hypothetical protein
MGAYFRKLPVPLKKSLDELDEARLWPYQLIPDGRITLPPEVTEQLGANEYLEWVLEADPSKTDGPRYSGTYRVLVTYYTGQPDQVPHIPDRCQIAAGYSPAGRERAVMSVDYAGQTLEVPFQVATYVKKTRLGSDRRTVMYSFYVNGDFEDDRTRVRLRLGRMGEKHAFYSKVEVSLMPSPEIERAVNVMEPFIRKLLPVLLEQHWPDWPPAAAESN